MSIDIMIYTSLEIDVLKEKLDLIKAEYKSVFDGPYILYDPDPVLNRKQLDAIEDRVDKYQKETVLLIAEEFGMHNPKSYFMTSLEDKSFSGFETDELADFFREKLGKDNIIVLFNGDEPI